MTTNGFPADGLQFTHMHMKSAQEALAEALELNPTPMSARFPLHEGKEKEGMRSYRLRDSLCNGVCGVLTQETTGDERNMGHRLELTIWNPNGVNSLRHTVAPVFSQGI